MATPQALTIRTFADRADGLGHFFQRAGEAPRLVALDDTIGCSMDTALSALEWSAVIGLLNDDDLVHAAQLTSEVSIALVERKIPEGRQFVYFGPRIDLLPVELMEGRVLIDEPGVKAVEFSHRAHGLAHFLRATGGASGIIALLGRRAPELRHMRRWLGAILNELAGSAPMIGGWFAASAAGCLFAVSDEEGIAYRYIEVGLES